MTTPIKLCLRLYRALARSFPHEFQVLYGEDLERLGEDAAPEIWRRHGVRAGIGPAAVSDGDEQVRFGNIPRRRQDGHPPADVDDDHAGEHRHGHHDAANHVAAHHNAAGTLPKVAAWTSCSR